MNKEIKKGVKEWCELKGKNYNQVISILNDYFICDFKSKKEVKSFLNCAEAMYWIGVPLDRKDGLI